MPVMRRSQPHHPGYLTDEGTGHDRIDTKSPGMALSGRPFRETGWYDEVAGTAQRVAPAPGRSA
jgi:hypothetical protein